QERARTAGRYLGLGIASYHEAAPGPPNYMSSVRPGADVLMGEEAWTSIMPDGSVEVYTSQMPHGQSHETTYGQIVADELGVSRHDVKIVYGDTRRTPFGFIGTRGRRGGPVGGGGGEFLAARGAPATRRTGVQDARGRARRHRDRRRQHSRG